MNTPEEQNCEEIQSKVQSLLDGDMCKEEAKAFLEYMESNPVCKEHLANYQNLRKLICEKVERKCCKEELKNNILEKINELH